MTSLSPPPTPRPPIFVGGSADHAFNRIANFGDGWMPGRAEPEALEGPIRKLNAITQAAGKPPPEVVANVRGPGGGEQQLRNRIAALAEIGVTRVAFTYPYEDTAGFRKAAEQVACLSNEP